jgi:ribosomal-protein-alanine N-acetyltransferase
MTIEIQATSLSMASVLAGLHAACFDDGRWSEDQIRGSLSLATTSGWVAMADKTMAGFLLCQKTVDDAEVLTLCVHPFYRRHGIGESLVKHMLRALPQGNAVFLEVAADNAAARQLYEKCGFVPAASRKGYYLREGAAVDAVCYRYASTGK